MISDPAKKIVFALTRFPVQLFGRLDEDNSDEHGIQRFAFGVSDQLTSTFFSNTRFIVPEHRQSILSDNAASFSAYYLPSVFNGVKSLLLGENSDILITDALSGCAFVVTKTKEGQVKAYHFNVQDERGNIDQQAIDSMIEQSTAGERIIFQIKKEDYHLLSRDPVCLVGIRSGSDWTFHYQLTAKTDKNDKTGRASFTYVNTMTEQQMDSALSQGK